MRYKTRFIAVVSPFVVVVGALLVGVNVPAMADTLSEQNVANLYKRHMPEVAALYLPHDGDYIAFPTYDPRKKNSSGIDERTWVKENTREAIYYDKQNRQQKRISTKVREEIEAVTKIIPDFKPGSYGYIQAGNVAQVDDDRVVLTNVTLVDAKELREEIRDFKTKVRREALRDMAEERDRARWRRDVSPIATERLDQIEEIEWQYEEREALADRQDDIRWNRLVIEGIDTRGIRKGDIWPSDPRRNVAIAVVAEDGRTVNAVPATMLRSKLTDEQFMDMLAKRGLDRAGFAQLMLDIREEFPRNYLPEVIAELERRAASQRKQPQQRKPARDTQRTQRDSPSMLQAEREIDEQWQELTQADSFWD